MDESTITFTSDDGIEIQTWRWAPDGEPRAVIQVQHGLGEHAGRYRRFGEALTDAGYVVYAPDGRGSGRTAQGDYGNWGPDSWKGWVNDLWLLNRRLREDHPDLPLGHFGHSMGSFATQQFLLDHSDAVDAAVLCGTTEVGGMADTMMSGEPLDLSAFNAPFEFRTGFEWLSRDEAEVDKYVADESCGFEFEEFRGMEALKEAADPARIAGVRKDLPLLLISGTVDPLAGGGDVIELVGQRYRDAGLADVTVKLYPEARHEVLNETNRDDVTRDVLDFFGRTL